MKDFRKIYEWSMKCQNIVNMAYAQKNREIHFPIDMCMVAQFLGIELELEKFASFYPFPIEIAQLQFSVGHSVTPKIMVNIDSQEDPYDLNTYSEYELFGIAREIAKFLVELPDYSKMSAKQVHDWNLGSVPHYYPCLLFSDEIYFSYECCALFLLLPLEKFLSEFLEFAKLIEQSPIMIDKWISKLSEKTYIPYILLVENYAYLKMAATQYYQEKMEEPEFQKYITLFH